MLAAVVHSFDQPLVIEDRPSPTPGPGQVLVRIEASGLCHTDIHAAHGDWPVKPTPPFVPGHEGVGIVTALGDGVNGIAVGDRVAVPWLGWACGSCEWCASGWETLCPNQRNTGYSVDGGFAEYVVADAALRRPNPRGHRPPRRRTAHVRGVTTYKAVKVPGTRPSDLVAVFGIGGLGHLAMQYAQIAGGTVAAVDVIDSKLAAGQGPRRRVHDQRHAGGSGRRHPGPRRGRCGHRPRGYSHGMRAGLPFAAPQRATRLRRAPRRQRDAAADLRNRAAGNHRDRLDRRYPRRPGRDVSSCTPPAGPPWCASSASCPRSTRPCTRSSTARSTPASCSI